MTSTAIVATGSRSASGTGPGRGIDFWAFEESGARCVSSLDLPDPVAVIWSRDGALLYAVLDTDPVRLVTIRVAVDGSAAEVVGELQLEGRGAQHLNFTKRPGTIAVALADPGCVCTVRLDESGVATTVLDSAQLDSLEKDSSPLPVEVLPLPGLDLLAVVDQKLSSVYLMHEDGAGQLDLYSEIPLGRSGAPSAIGADHEAQIVYILDAEQGEVAVASRRSKQDDKGKETYSWQVRTRIRATGMEAPARPSHISMSLRENHVLVANQGVNTLAALSLSLMQPEIVAEIEVADGPVHFERWGHRVLVVARDAEKIDVLNWDGRAFSRPDAQFADLTVPGITDLAVRP